MAASPGGLEVERERIEGEPAQQAEMPFLDLPEQNVKREPDRQIKHHADHRRGYGGERSGQPAIGAQPLDEGCPGEDPQH